MSLIRKLALLYAVLFLFVAVMGYIPPFVDENGDLFGLFKLDLYDNLLHAFSGIWAFVAGLMSDKQAARYFKIFGTAYFLDGVMGLLFGNAFLDFSIVKYGIADSSFVLKFFLNIPHVIIGGLAALAGFCLPRARYDTSAPAPDANASF
jgi:hypothetical protein